MLKPLDCLRSSPSSPSSPSVEATSLLFPSSRSTHKQFAASTMSARLVLQSTAIVFLAHLPPTLRNFLSLEGASAPLTTTTVHNRKVVDHRVCLLLLSVAVSSASTPAPGQGHSVYSLARAARAHCHKNFSLQLLVLCCLCVCTCVLNYSVHLLRERSRAWTFSHSWYPFWSRFSHLAKTFVNQVRLILGTTWKRKRG